MSPIHEAVLHALYRCEVTAEEHLAHLTGLPVDTVIRVLRDLEAEGFVQPESD